MKNYKTKNKAKTQTFFIVNSSGKKVFAIEKNGKYVVTKDEEGIFCESVITASPGNSTTMQIIEKMPAQIFYSDF